MAFTDLISHTHVKWFTDSQAAAKIVETGCNQLELHKIAIDIFNFSLEHGLTLDIQWILRELNTRADFINELKNKRASTTVILQLILGL